VRTTVRVDTIGVAALLVVVAIVLCGCAVRSTKLSHTGAGDSGALSIRLYEMHLIEVSPRAIVAGLTITNRGEHEVVLSADEITLWDAAGNSVTAVGELPPPPAGGRSDPSWLPAARIATAPLQVALFLMTLPISLPMTIATAARKDQEFTPGWQTQTLCPKCEIPLWISFRELQIDLDRVARLRVRHPATGTEIEIPLRP
jgi:hypothetical protein